MENVLYWRRKLLDFDHKRGPVQKSYIHQNIPRYYSSYYPWFWTFNNPPSAPKTIYSGKYYETIDYPPKLELLSGFKFKINWVLLIAIIYLLFMNKLTLF